MKARRVRGDMLDGFESGFFRLLQVATPCGLLGASEIQGFPREFARFMDGPDLQDIRRGQHGINMEFVLSLGKVMQWGHTSSTLNVPITLQVAQQLYKRSEEHTSELQ